MTVIVLIRRVARLDKLPEFLAAYKAERPKHPGFISEYLTEVDVNVPSPLRSLDLSTAAGKAFVNVAFWRSEADFRENFPKAADGMFDPDTEVSPRTRITLQIKDTAGYLPTLPEGLTLR